MLLGPDSALIGRRALLRGFQRMARFDWFSSFSLGRDGLRLQESDFRLAAKGHPYPFSK